MVEKTRALAADVASLALAMESFDAEWSLHLEAVVARDAAQIEEDVEVGRAGRLLMDIRQFCTNAAQLLESAPAQSETVPKSLVAEAEYVATLRRELSDALGARTIGPDDPAYAGADAWLRRAGESEADGFAGSSTTRRPATAASGGMNDPIADLLTKVRTASTLEQESVAMPFSKLKSHIAEILAAEGYIEGWSVEEGEDGKTLRISLKYGPNRERTIAGMRRVSKPGLRVYAKSTNLPKVLGGLGVAIISTPSGLLTDQQAAERGVGGEVLAYIW